jgi:plasmid stability protein
MARSLIVRNLDDELVRRLKLRAARHGRSAEAEHRAILHDALAAEPAGSLKEVAARLREVLLRQSRDER